MLQISTCKKGQSVSGEYVVLIALVSIAVIAMVTYVRRAIQGRYHDGSNAVYSRAAGTLGKASVLPEYEPYYVNTSTDMMVKSEEEQSGTVQGLLDKKHSLDRSVSSKSEQKPF